VDAKYEPGVRAVVLYQHGADLVRGDLLTPDPPTEAKQILIQPGVQLSVFPHDPDLPTLPRAMDAAEVGPLLAEVLPHRAGLDRRALALRCSVLLLRYRPGKRATVKLTAGLRGTSYVGKVYHDPVKAAAVAHEAQLLADAENPHGIVRFARTVAHVPELSLVVQQVVQGEFLDALVAAPRGTSATAVRGLHRAARALAQMHDGPIVSTRQRPVEKELHRFGARAARISTVDAQAGGKLGSLAERLLDTYAGLPAGPLGLVHGDCKPGQFLLAEGGPVYLLDLDHCGVSDQAGDVGTFAASLRQLAVQRIASGATPDQTASLIALADTFIVAYTKHRKNVDLPTQDLYTRIRWQEAVALQRKALRAFARAPKSPVPAALVDEGHRCLDRVIRKWA
jgi:aminoglycoside phosphotransferase (APT) family kinase protein